MELIDWQALTQALNKNNKEVALVKLLAEVTPSTTIRPDTAPPGHPSARVVTQMKRRSTM
jgi:hypothetical protein